MTAFLVVLALRLRGETGDDSVDAVPEGHGGRQRPDEAA
jgi:hypothetical protein